MDSPVDADLVVGVPESGNAAALGYSMAVGDSIWNCICEKRLCGKNLHQAEAEQQRVQRTSEIKCIKRSGRWKDVSL